MSTRKSGHIFKHGRCYWIKYSRQGKPYKESSRSDKESVAKRLLAKRLGEIAASRFVEPGADKVTVRELAADFITDYRVNGFKSLAKAERMLTRTAVKRGEKEKKKVDSPLMVFFGDYRAHDVGADMVKKYVAMRLEQQAQNATINRELAALKRMFSLGIQAEKIYRKPYIAMLKENNVRKGFFEYGEFLAFRDALPDYLKPVVTFAYFTGWRRGEIAGLKWNQVDLSARTVRLEVGETKSDKGRTIALDDELLEVMQAQWERRKVAEIPGQSPTLLCPYVFHRGGKPIGDFRDAWDKACEATGLAGKIFHDFRRTAVRNMVRAGVHERVAMMVSGHKTRSVFDRYDIVDEEDLKEAARKTSEHARNQSSKSNVVALKAGQQG